MVEARERGADDTEGESETVKIKSEILKTENCNYLYNLNSFSFLK